MAKADPKVVAELARLGFDKAMHDISPIVYMGLDGRDKSGKTDFCLRATPAPIGLWNINRGLDGVIQKFQKKKDIYVREMHTTSDQGQAIEQIKELREAWTALLKIGIRTLVVDNFGEIWELARIAEFGKVSARAREYGNLNSFMDELLDEPLKYETNVILLHNLRDEYVGDERTGNLARWGYKNVKHKVQINCRIEYFEEDGEKLRYMGTDNYKRLPVTEKDLPEGEEFVFTINNSRFGVQHRGVQFRGQKCNFRAVAQYLHPDVPPAYWL